VSVEIKLSPVFENYAATIQALGCSGPGARKYFESSLIKEQVLFVSRQPGPVKVTMRLIKWWREQQAWSCGLTRPSDYLLELVVIYTYQQAKLKDQQQAVAYVMEVLSKLDEVRILWTTNYKSTDIWQPLLLQKPLLMDPVNPFVNVADPQVFDPRELMELAATTHFFW